MPAADHPDNCPAMRAESDADVLRCMLDAVEDYAIYMLDPDGVVMTWNTGAERNKGYTAAEIIGRNYACFFTAQARARRRPERELAEARDSGCFREEGWRVRKDGSLFWAEIVLNAIRDDAGRLVGFAKVTRDLIERMMRERSLLDARLQAERASQAKSDFLATMSHELRTPLTAIAGALGILGTAMAESIPEKPLEVIRIAQRNSERLVMLINDILDFEKLVAGKMSFDLGTHGLAGLVEQSLDANAGYAAKFGVTFELAAPDRETQVRVDPNRFAQVMDNLLSNAAKFSPFEGRVEVTLGREGDTATVSVRDHGEGIPEPFRPRVFQKFEQAERSDARARGGTGLGLSIGKEIVDRMGGGLSFETATGEGTTFTISLPVAAGEAAGEAAGGTAPDAILRHATARL